MRYVSTRDPNGVADQSFCDILLTGLAPDGGLYVPQHYPQVQADTLAAWRQVFWQQGYAALAHAVISLFIDDIPADDLRGICDRAYAMSTFDAHTPQEVAAVSAIPSRPGLFVLHLSNGPTAAFKDMAMQLLGQLFEYELARRQEQLTILGATSGDTGSSAEYAMLGKDRLRVFMLSPAGRMTPFQQAQMFSITDPAVVNIAVEGVFDDCQDIVKAINADADFKATYRIGAVNSINWARLLAQVVYYVAAWIQVTQTDDQQVSFAIPTGNFGNIAAGHVARSMGVPIDRLICATNENDVLAEFFATGRYRVRSGEQTLATSSPSMDISKASNFERFIFDLLGRDGSRVAELFGDLVPSQGQFSLADDPAFAQVATKYGFMAGTSTHADRIATIAALEASDAIAIDPHTADGVQVASTLMAPGQVSTPVVVAETALLVKFAQTCREALGREPELPPRFAGLSQAARRVIEVPNDVQTVKHLISASFAEQA